MKIIRIVARALLGLLFLFSGLNGLFLHVMPEPKLTGLAVQYMSVLTVSHYFLAVFLLEAVGGALLLANRFVPLALVLLGPVLVNILLYHCLMNPQGLPPALVATVLWLIVYSQARSAFAGIFATQPSSVAAPQDKDLELARS